MVRAQWKFGYPLMLWNSRFLEQFNSHRQDAGVFHSKMWFSVWRTITILLQLVLRFSWVHAQAFISMAIYHYLSLVRCQQRSLLARADPVSQWVLRDRGEEAGGPQHQTENPEVTGGQYGTMPKPNIHSWLMTIHVSLWTDLKRGGYPSIWPSIYPASIQHLSSLYPSIYPSIHHPFVHLSIHLPTYPSIRISYPPIYLSVCTSCFLYVFLIFLYLSLSLCIYIIIYTSYIYIYMCILYNTLYIYNILVIQYIYIYI